MTYLFSILLGILVSIFELVCTGQIYFPTIAYMIKAQTHRMNAIMYLILYNAAFIIPLLVVLVAVTTGMSIKRIEIWFKSHLGLSKIGVTLLFGVLTIVLLA